MEENNPKSPEINDETSPEEKLQNANLSAEKLIEELDAKRNEYTTVLTELTQKKESIESMLNELTSAKQTFIDDINQKLEEYQVKFDNQSSAIEEFKKSMIESEQELTNKMNSWITGYEKTIQEFLQESQKNSQETKDLLTIQKQEFESLYSQIKADTEQKSNELSKKIAEFGVSATESVTKIKANMDESVNSNAKIKQLEADVKAFKENVDEYLENMTTKTKEINVKTEEFSKHTQEIIDTNSNLTAEIQEQLKKATGVSLFHMFQNRRDDLEKNQCWWLTGIILSIIVLIAFSCWILASINTVPQNGSMDWFKDAIFKFTLSTPVIYLLYFLTDRYTKLRRLIEEYAFKSAISLALTPYFDLVKGLDPETEEKDKDFLITVIGNIFKTPTDKVFRTKEGHFDLDFSNYYKNIASALIPGSNKEEQVK